MMPSLLELSAPKHIKFVDEYVYFYTGSAPRADNDYPAYCALVTRTLKVYRPLDSLDDEVIRGSPIDYPHHK